MQKLFKNFFAKNQQCVFKFFEVLIKTKKFSKKETSVHVNFSKFWKNTKTRTHDD